MSKMIYALCVCVFILLKIYTSEIVSSMFQGHGCDGRSSKSRKTKKSNTRWRVSRSGRRLQVPPIKAPAGPPAGDIGVHLG